MPTRSGKEYLVSYECQECKKFFGHPNFGFKCSGCAGHSVTQKRMTEKDLQEWTVRNTLQGSNMADSTWLNALRRTGRGFKSHAFHLDLLRHMHEHTGKWLAADDALNLLKKAGMTNKMTHVYGCYVADWWNIDSRKTDWPAFAACYYGNFNEGSSCIGPLPPRSPNPCVV